MEVEAQREADDEARAEEEEVYDDVLEVALGASVELCVLY